MKTRNIKGQHSVAATLMRAYIFERTMWTRTLDSRDEGYKYRLPAFWVRTSASRSESARVWDRVAASCRDRGFDPIRYIRWSLRPAGYLPSSVPEPNQLLQHERMSNFSRMYAVEHREIRRTWELQRGKAAARMESAQRHSRMTPEMSWVHCLVGPDDDMTPLFRFVLAWSIKLERFQEIAARFRLNALNQYHYCPDIYDEVWGAGLFPAGFADEADALYLRLISSL